MRSEAADGPVFLDSYLAPLAPYLARDDVTDLYVNKPGELWVEAIGGGVERHALPQLTAATLERLARQIAALSHQGISREHPLLAATLPDGARVQIVAPPATRGAMAIALRKHATRGLTLADYARGGAFDGATYGGDPHAEVNERLHALRDAGEIAAMLSLAVRERRNILVSGGTSTGKTTFLNALLREIAPDERLILIEDTPELSVAQPNFVGLVAARSELGEARVTADDLLAASLRMRPDRIILGELRGREAFTFLRAVNTGHPGSMTTVHADSAERAIEQITLLVLQAGAGMSRADVHHHVRSTIDVFVQLERVNGRRRVTQVVLREG